MSNGAESFSQALVALNARDFQAAERRLREVLSSDGAHVPALNLLAVVLMQLERFAEAEPIIERAVALNRSSDVSFYNYGLIAKQLGKPQLAFEQFSAALKLNPAVRETWNNRGTVANDLAQFERAIADFDKAIALDRNYADAYVNKGKSLLALKRYEEALAAFDHALALSPGLALAQLGRGKALAHLNRPDEALAAFDEAVSISPALADGWLERGNVLSLARRYDEAVAAFDKALTIAPGLAEAWLGKGNVDWNRGAYETAFAAYEYALTIKPDLAEAWLGRGNFFWSVKRHAEALAAYDKALSISPALEAAWLGRANTLYDLKRYDEAIAAYDRALALKPDMESAWLGRGNVCNDLKRYREALDAYDRALAIDPLLEGGEGTRLLLKLHLCEWGSLSADSARLHDAIERDHPVSPPFVLIAMGRSAEAQLRCARAWIAAKFPKRSASLRDGAVRVHDKIHIGYVSADFHGHATAYLLAEALELHDKSRFRVTAFSLGPDDRSDIRKRLVGAVDEFVECRDLSDLDVARAVAASEIDILVDLKGFTKDARTNIFAYRPAPIQVNYLGYPGTMGAPYIDYIIGDKAILDRSDGPAYAEKLVRLPHSYQPHDRKRAVVGSAPGRGEVGLPEHGFVFCSFNNNYKILPDIFDSWMRILRSVEGSVLWLFVENGIAVSNLIKEAAARGVDADRLVFAERAEPAAHLARQRLADLFLDTVPCNAHTTASDALWAGLPILTQRGSTFAGRVAASLLLATELPELVAHSSEDYEARAIELARDADRLRSVRSKIARNRLNAPLFDTPNFTQALETAYETMYQRYRTGLPPDHIDVPDRLG
jgi:predicted O-linked N-acetylglucosamine transferase (SPINDLY family)